MVSVLIKIFGSEHIELAEDTVQDALIAAFESWKFNGIPDNPRAWLYKTAKNKAIDIIRRKKHSYAFDFSDPSHQLLTSEYTLSTTMNNYWEEDSIQDDFLGMMYACCQPEIPRENQITFILKSLCGFSTKEVAKSFVTNEDTVSKRLYRTKEFFRKNKIRPEIPSSDAIQSRTSTVLSAIYLMFNEGYNSTHSDSLVRKDLIEQAMHLCTSLLSNKRSQLPEVYALMAYMCFHASRTNSRTSPEGELVLLSQQDRSIWDRDLINAGNEYMNKSAFGSSISSYHLEAAIAFEHCTAASFELTNWKAILGCYNSLLAQRFDPIVYLNRSIVLLELEGPIAALRSLKEVSENKHILKYYLYYSLLGEINSRIGKRDKARNNYLKALKLTHSKHEKVFLESKIARL